MKLVTSSTFCLWFVQTGRWVELQEPCKRQIVEQKVYLKLFYMKFGVWLPPNSESSTWWAVTSLGVLLITVQSKATLGSPIFH